MRLVVLPYFCDKKKQKQSGNGLEISCVYTMKGRKYMLVRIEYMIKGQFRVNEMTKMLNIFHISKKCVCFVNLLKTHDPCLLTGLRAHAKYKIFHKIKFQIFTKYFIKKQYLLIFSRVFSKFLLVKSQLHYILEIEIS